MNEFPDPEFPPRSRNRWLSLDQINLGSAGGWQHRTSCPLRSPRFQRFVEYGSVTTRCPSHFIGDLHGLTPLLKRGEVGKSVAVPVTTGEALTVPPLATP